MDYKFRELRIEKGLTQKELACEINSTDKNIWAYEKGIATPPYEVLISYAKFFGVTTDYILGLEDSYRMNSLDQPNEPERYSKEEKEIIKKYRSVDDKFKKLIRDQLFFYSSN